MTVRQSGTLGGAGVPGRAGTSGKAGGGAAGGAGTSGGAACRNRGGALCQLLGLELQVWVP